MLRWNLFFYRRVGRGGRAGRRRLPVPRQKPQQTWKPRRGWQRTQKAQPKRIGTQLVRYRPQQNPAMPRNGAQNRFKGQYVKYPVQGRYPVRSTRPGVLAPSTHSSRSARSFDINQYTSNIESELPRASETDTSGPKLVWPSQLLPIYAISMRAYRFQNLLQRMKQWAPLITLLPATDGRKIAPKQWKLIGRLKTHLANGQIGCYESHVRVWQQIVDRNLSSALVLEDDAAITYTQDTVDRLNEFLTELKTVPNWDLAYIGNIGLHPAKQQLTKHIYEPSDWEGLYTYYITNTGARKLLKDAFPISKAVDLFVGEEARHGKIRTVAMSPPLNYVVPVESDTDKKILK